MHAFLLLGKKIDLENRSLSNIEIPQKFLDFKMCKIKDVRNLLAFSKLSREEKICIRIKDINQATEEAQNAFLKILEEPPKNVYFLLTADSENGILPTVVSRCQIIKTANKNSNAKKKFDPLGFFNSKISERVEKIKSIQKRKDAIEFINECVEFLHSELVGSPPKMNSWAKNLKAAQRTLSSLKANGNVFLQLLAFSIKTSNWSDLNK